MKEQLCSTAITRDEWDSRLAENWWNSTYYEGRDKGNDVSNYRPIAVLSLMWKIMAIWEVKNCFQGKKGVSRKSEGGKGLIVYW